MEILCARLLFLVTMIMIWSGGDRRMARCVVASRTGWVAIACRGGVAGSGRVTRDQRLAGLGLWRLPDRRGGLTCVVLRLGGEDSIQPRNGRGHFLRVTP
jgi:hypothetical protein